MRLDFVSIGEVMVQFNPLASGPLRYVRYYEVHVAGTEANMLVGLTKLGYRTGIITRVGDDEFGKLIVNFLRGEGVDVSRVRIDPEAYTGIYFIQRHFPVPGSSTVYYYRRGSAASKLSPEDVDEEYVAHAGAVILTGITLALSESCRRAVEKMYGIAISQGKDVIFDTNIRMKLWRREDRAREAIARFLGAKLVFTNREDLGILFPGLSVIDAAKRIIDRGSELVVVKMGPEGAIAVDKEHRVYKSQAFSVPHVEDVVGAGDSFNAAFIASIYRGEPIENALLYANAAGALAVTVRGDVEAQPSWDDLRLFLESQGKALMLR